MNDKLHLDDTVSALTDEQFAGQRMIVGFDGTEFNEDLEFLIRDLKVGGIILFARNIVTPDQVGNLCGDVQAFAKKCEQPALFIAIDQEGGVVSRLKEPFTQFPLGNPGMKKVEDAIEFARITSDELNGIGVNMNMAPVIDVQPVGFDSVMAKRVFPGDEKFIAEMGSAMISEFQRNGIMAVAKHFPGIGRTTLDSHLTLPELDCDYEKFQKSDLLPFKKSISHNVAGMMMSHIQYNFIDSDWPASLSVKVVKDLLRSKLNYQGVVMTDDLDMKAVKTDIETSVKRIIEAEVDIALICHKGDDIENAFELFLSNIKSTDENRLYCRKSVERVLSLKRKFQLA